MRDINTGSPSAAITEMVVANGRLMFSAISSGQRELWSSDGTDGGTVMVRNFYSGNSGEVSDLVVMPDGGVMFAATESAGRFLFFTDGTTGGTRQITTGPYISDLTELIAAGNYVYFSGLGFTGGRELRAERLLRGQRESAVRSRRRVAKAPLGQRRHERGHGAVS